MQTRRRRATAGAACTAPFWFSASVPSPSGLAIPCLFIDFAEIESARKEKLSAKTERYCAFSVVVTLIWIYIEILRTLRRFRR